MAKVLVIDNDRDITELLHAVLTDEGHAVSTLTEITSDAIRAAVGQLEPDCILLDGQSPMGYGHSWTEAVWLHARARPIPAIMFTAHEAAVREAEEGASERSRAAGFAAVILKPFDLDQLVAAVGRVVDQSAPFDSSAEAEAARTSALADKLREAGASDIYPSTQREWANFRNAQGAFMQLYWWQRDGIYYVLRHAESGGILRQVGRFYDLEAAIAMAMTVRPSEA